MNASHPVKDEGGSIYSSLGLEEREEDQQETVAMAATLAFETAHSLHQPRADPPRQVGLQFGTILDIESLP